MITKVKQKSQAFAVLHKEDSAMLIRYLKAGPWPSLRLGELERGAGLKADGAWRNG